MSGNNSNRARVSLHRFRDRAALSLTGADAGTVYLDAKAARELAREAARLARSLERETFAESNYKQAARIEGDSV